MATTFHYSTIAAETNKEIDISLTPASTFIELNKLKPGDTITKTVSVKNSGLMNFSYLMNAYKESGSDLFYNQLHLEFFMGDILLYNGSLGSFTGIEARELKHSSSEEMKLKVSFPWESGNEFQGLSANVVFQFIAEEVYAQDGIAAEGGMLPQTGEKARSMFYMIGGVLVCFGGALYTSYYVKRRKE